MHFNAAKKKMKMYGTIMYYLPSDNNSHRQAEKRREAYYIKAFIRRCDFVCAFWLVFNNIEFTTREWFDCQWGMLSLTAVAVCFILSRGITLIKEIRILNKWYTCP